MKRLQEGENLLLDLYSQRGYRVSELRGGMNPLQKGIENSNATGAQDIKQKYAQALAKYPQKQKAILAKYKQETGEDYS